MTMQPSPVPLYFPELCPECSSFDAGSQKCLATATAAGLKLPSEVMIAGLTGLCPYYEASPVPMEIEKPEFGTSTEVPRPTVEIEDQSAIEVPATSNEVTTTLPVEPAAAAEQAKAEEVVLAPVSEREAAEEITTASAVIPAGPGEERGGVIGEGLTALDEAVQVVAEAEGAVPPELQPDIPVEEAAKIVSTPPVEEVATDQQPVATIEEHTTRPEAAATGQVKPLGEARIHCPKCKVENASSAVRCQNCGEMLLRAESASVRVLFFVFGVLFAGLFAYLFYQYFILNPESAPNLSFVNPVTLGIAAIASLIAGIVLAVRRSPEYQKYETRARSHLRLNIWQSLADVNKAIILAPDKSKDALIKLRAQVYDGLGMSDDASRDRLTLITSPNAYKAEADTVSLLTGADADVYASARRKDQLQAVLSSGNVVAVGYCPRCKSVVELNAEQRCKVHVKTRGQDVEYVIAADATRGRLAVLRKLEHKHREAMAQLTGMIAVGEVAAVGYCRKCRAVVGLDVERKCIVHQNVRGKWTAYSVPGEVEKAKVLVKEDMKKRIIVLRNLRNVLMVLIVLSVLVLVYFAMNG